MPKQFTILDETLREYLEGNGWREVRLRNGEARMASWEGTGPRPIITRGESGLTTRQTNGRNYAEYPGTTRYDIVGLPLQPERLAKTRTAYLVCRKDGVGLPSIRRDRGDAERAINLMINPEYWCFREITYDLPSEPAIPTFFSDVQI